MAARSLKVDMADEDLVPAWGTVIELSEFGISPDLTLLGGLVILTLFRQAMGLTN